ncbi:hypothetical protein KY284_008095 [Solanum tuberosum]|nr:hypothetical protein KY284_008095 [Solanum tuberosum]
MEHPDFKSTLKQVREMDITGQPLVKKLHVAREKLNLIQRHIQDDLMDQMLFDQEKMLLLEIEKWSRKIRCSHNAINSIYTENNTKLIDPRAIEAKFIGVFTGLMGASTSVCLTLQQQKEMIKEVTQEEIIEAIKNMPKEKAPGVDGFPIEFFTGTGI